MSEGIPQWRYREYIELAKTNHDAHIQSLIDEKDEQIEREIKELEQELLKKFEPFACEGEELDIVYDEKFSGVNVYLVVKTKTDNTFVSELSSHVLLNPGKRPYDVLDEEGIENLKKIKALHRKTVHAGDFPEALENFNNYKKKLLRSTGDQLEEYDPDKSY